MLGGKLDLLLQNSPEMMYQVGTAMRVRAFTQECRNQYVCSALGRPMRMCGGTTSRARPASGAPDQSRQDEAEAMGDVAVGGLEERQRRRAIVAWIAAAVLVVAAVLIPV
jgi:hypothetical protein